jgi:hypothetical protein
VLELAYYSYNANATVLSFRHRHMRESACLFEEGDRTVYEKRNNIRRERPWQLEQHTVLLRAILVKLKVYVF